MKRLYLCLDSLWEEGFLNSPKYDLRGAGHSITIRPEDRDAFLDDYAAQWRKRVDDMLEEFEEDEE